MPKGNCQNCVFRMVLSSTYWVHIHKLFQLSADNWSEQHLDKLIEKALVICKSSQLWHARNSLDVINVINLLLHKYSSATAIAKKLIVTISMVEQYKYMYTVRDQFIFVIGVLAKVVLYVNAQQVLYRLHSTTIINLLHLNTRVMLIYYNQSLIYT